MRNIILRVSPHIVQFTDTSLSGQTLRGPIFFYSIYPLRRAFFILTLENSTSFKLFRSWMYVGIYTPYTCVHTVEVDGRKFRVGRRSAHGSRVCLVNVGMEFRSLVWNCSARGGCESSGGDELLMQRVRQNL